MTRPDGFHMLHIVHEDAKGKKTEDLTVILTEESGRLLTERIAQTRGRPYKLYKYGDLIGTYHPGGWES